MPPELKEIMLRHDGFPSLSVELGRRREELIERHLRELRPTRGCLIAVGHRELNRISPVGSPRGVRQRAERFGPRG